ncbi:MAG: RsmE family RNA methyltransferase [Candidatus Pacebacteria bacterium]|nr:RsmE family RNA methyltransferase [Candidatus Paceibacterota bacterium]
MNSLIRLLDLGSNVVSVVALFVIICTPNLTGARKAEKTSLEAPSTRVVVVEIGWCKVKGDLPESGLRGMHSCLFILPGVGGKPDTIEECRIFDNPVYKPVDRNDWEVLIISIQKSGEKNRYEVENYKPPEDSEEILRTTVVAWLHGQHSRIPRLLVCFFMQKYAMVVAMRLHRFFIAEKLEGKDTITIRNRELHHQLKDVFRFQVGSSVLLLDNSGFEFEAVITSFEVGNLDFKIVRSEKVKNIPKREIYLFASLIKKDKFEWVLEKGTEIGVTHFIPIISERSEKKSLNIERARKIIQEASEQSGRGILPELHNVMTLENALSSTSGEIIAFDFSGIPFKDFKLQSDICKIFIGPEGGWSERELKKFIEKGAKIVSLGGQVLRAETASLVVSTLFLLS